LLDRSSALLTIPDVALPPVDHLLNHDVPVDNTHVSKKTPNAALRPRQLVKIHDVVSLPGIDP